MSERTPSGEPASAPYRVLARKYRPVSFAGLIGQDAMVRTLSNAIRAQRLAHAYLLTGVRGVGKTTTARIIARALNCTGADGKGGPTPEPCGVCEHCVAITEDRHVDVLEIDAASRPGVGDIRELIEGVRYKPVSARYKVYIVDEVHMLSVPAFNALLKTLEEPPEHVKFIFATTEARKIPVTVLSRCQRFDLRRVDADALASHFQDVAAKEKVKIDGRALALIARAADGSVRDGLSLLDQAIADGAGTEAGAGITEEKVRGMLGLADRTKVFDLFDAVMKGDIKEALELLGEQHDAGADATVVLGDLLALTHWLTRVKITPGLAEDVTVPEAERVRGRELAEGLSMPALARAWQMLLKGLSEALSAPSALQAAEMVLVRVAFAANLPAPAEIIESLRQNADTPTRAPAPSPGPADAAPSASVDGGHGGETPRTAAAGGRAAAPSETSAATGAPTALRRPGAALAQNPEPALETDPATDHERAAPAGLELGSFEEVVDLFAAKREGVLHAHLVSDVHLVLFEPGRIEFRPGAHAPRHLANRLSELLSRWTGRRWVVSVSGVTGAPTLAEQTANADEARKTEAAHHPLVRAALEAFPGAKIAQVRAFAPAPAEVVDADPDPESAAQKGEGSE
ncbi:MAG: DNA polymerase III subunit gamma/tau [Alphaproteobacteria bacterium]